MVHSNKERKNSNFRCLGESARSSFLMKNPIETRVSKSKSVNRQIYPRENQNSKNPRTTVIIPTLNEEKTIGHIIKALHRLGLRSILVIDGKSTDNTVKVAEDLGVTILNQDGKGKGDALRKAFNHDGLNDWVVIMDADGSMNPGEISSFLGHLENGIDVVKASRFMPQGFSEDMTFSRRLGNAIFVLLVNMIWKTDYTDLCYGFAAFKKKAIQKLYPYLESRSFEIEAELFIKAKKLGLKIKEVPSVELRRKHGKSNLNAFKDGFLILKTIINEALYA
jgi:glycosyltransferase involved in cell wall biosynthesis